VANLSFTATHNQFHSKAPLVLHLPNSKLERQRLLTRGEHDTVHGWLMPNVGTVSDQLITVSVKLINIRL